MMLLDIDVDVVEKALRILAAALCNLIYKIVAALFELFINISRVELLSSNDIAKIYQRVTLIITIIMIFYVTFETVKYVIQPDTMGDKEKGTSKVVSKMIICVVLLAMVPKVFEFAFKLQNTIIDNQIIPKLILGPSATSASKPKDMGRSFAASTFALFYGYIDIPGEELLSDEYCQDNSITAEELDKFEHLANDYWWDIQRRAMMEKSEEYSTYGNGYAGANLCYFKNNGSFWHLTWGLGEEDTETDLIKDDEEYIEFDGLMAIIVGGFMVYVLALYCIDLGTRVAQLAFLQIIAPIPIIGYLSPKKDNIFSKWVKQCTTTYIDLFLRMILIYFVLFLCNVIQTARANGTLFNNIPADSNKTLLYIAIILGLLMFAQKAPKMLQELFPKMGAASGNLGLSAKDRNIKTLGRFAGAAAGGAIGAAVGGISGIAQGAKRRKAVKAAGGDKKAQRRAAIAGGVSGALRGTSGGLTRGIYNGGKKGNMFKNAVKGTQNQINKNKQFGTRQENGYSTMDQIGDRFRNLTGMKSRTQVLEEEKAPLKRRQDIYDSLAKTNDSIREHAFKKAKDKGLQSYAAYAAAEGRLKRLQEDKSVIDACVDRDASGNIIARGENSQAYKDAIAEATKDMKKYKDQATNEYIDGHKNGTFTDGNLDNLIAGRDKAIEDYNAHASHSTYVGEDGKEHNFFIENLDEDVEIKVNGVKRNVKIKDMSAEEFDEYIKQIAKTKSGEMERKISHITSEVEAIKRTTDGSGIGESKK